MRRSILRIILGQKNKVIGELNNAVRSDPRSVSARRHRGNWHLSNGNARAALTDLNIVLKKHPRDSFILGAKINALLRVGETVEAEKVISNMLAIDNNRYRFILDRKVRSALHLQRAMLRREQKNFEDAATDAMAAVTLATKPNILRLQVFLRRSGFPNLPITGTMSERMKTAVQMCFGRTKCWSEVSRKL